MVISYCSKCGCGNRVKNFWNKRIQCVSCGIVYKIKPYRSKSYRFKNKNWIDGWDIGLEKRYKF